MLGGQNFPSLIYSKYFRHMVLAVSEFCGSEPSDYLILYHYKRMQIAMKVVYAS